jgi:hypothetical protein
MQQEFAELKDAIAALGESVDSSGAGNGEKQRAVMMGLLHLKASKRAFVSELVTAREACDEEKGRAESLHLRLQNLMFKRAQLLAGIGQCQAEETPHLDAMCQDTGVGGSMGEVEYSKDLHAAHEKVLRLLLDEQLGRKADKLALERTVREHEQQAQQLDKVRAFLDVDLKKSILQVDQTVSSVAHGFADSESADMEV